jgi:hypothetical protein
MNSLIKFISHLSADVALVAAVVAVAAALLAVNAFGWQ